ncbi:hypothetical protein C2869_04500 [Saccharobesus litoralis]|uniref:Methyl-accepting transducer domain-containing protein n=1 Tax=Saccharobesus litoralis TaxID=2172099 RepID=A0A2S0VNF3_9ALTE|nr:methyl-accepting chemotaxis protein [Saccharobesus litoralis]AWB65743.1 hypothetical protein C2869_04500 [Saccharobesus litoralis]
MTNAQQDTRDSRVLYMSLATLIVAGVLTSFTPNLVTWGWIVIAIIGLIVTYKMQQQTVVAHQVEQDNRELEKVQAEKAQLAEQLQTLQQQLETAQANETLYHSVLDLIPDWIYVKDTQHNYVFANKSFLEALPDLEIGYSDDKFMPPDFCKKIWHDEQAVIQRNMRLKDVEEQAGETWFSTTKVQWKDPKQANQVVGIIGVTRNVTEAVNDRLTVQNNSEQIKQKISRVHAIQSDTTQAREKAAQCSTVVDKMSQIIVEINSGNEQIEQTIELIKGLASQSKLLSINAAIEAAKAGESGRGFGVVAHEVRDLAERSEQAVTEIQSAINSSSQVINTGTGTMEETNKAFEVTIQHIESISGSLDELSDDLSRF